MNRLGSASGVSFLIGVLGLAALACIAAWPDMEASVFDPDTAQAGNPAPGMLHCPVVLAADETGTVTARFANRSVVTDSFRVRGRVSRGYVSFWRQHSEQVVLPPGATRVVTWPVSVADAAYRRLILVRVMALPSARSPARQASCGILVVGVNGVPGRWLFAAALLLALSLLVAGALGWLRGQRDRGATGAPGARRSVREALGQPKAAIARRLGFVALVVGSSLLAGLWGWWLASLLLLFVAVLAAVTLLEQPRGGGQS